jgi:hypothetical protein
MVGIRSLLFIVLVALPLAACRQPTAEAGQEEAAVVELVDGSDLSRIRLSANAAERLGIELSAVEEVIHEGVSRLAVPYGAVFYDATGATWAYANPEPLIFIRASIVVDRIDGDQAILSDGPAPGTMVVIVGAAELWGTETGVGGSGH